MGTVPKFATASSKWGLSPFPPPVPANDFVPALDALCGGGDQPCNLPPRRAQGHVGKLARQHPTQLVTAHSQPAADLAGVKHVERDAKPRDAVPDRGHRLAHDDFEPGLLGDRGGQFVGPGAGCFALQREAWKIPQSGPAFAGRMPPH